MAHYCVKTLVAILCVFFVFPCVLCKLCALEVECSCTPTIINCENGALNTIPQFLTSEKLDVVYLNLRKNFITNVRILPKSEWMNLKVLYLLFYFVCVVVYCCFNLLMCIIFFQTINLIDNPLSCGIGFKNISCEFNLVLTSQCEGKSSSYV